MRSSTPLHQAVKLLDRGAHLLDRPTQCRRRAAEIRLDRPQRFEQGLLLRQKRGGFLRAALLGVDGIERRGVFGKARRLLRDLLHAGERRQRRIDDPQQRRRDSRERQKGDREGKTGEAGEEGERKQKLAMDRRRQQACQPFAAGSREGPHVPSVQVELPPVLSELPAHSVAAATWLNASGVPRRSRAPLHHGRSTDERCGTRQ